LANLFYFLALYAFASAGMAVFRTHSISVAAEIAKSDSSQKIDRTNLEKLVRSTGNTEYYYRILANVAVLGGSTNAIVFVALLWLSKRKQLGSK